MEVQIQEGIIKLRKPLAGERNKALMKAETPEGLKGTVFLVELLPNIITGHPFGAKPIKEALNLLSIEDYDKLINALTKMINYGKGDVEKKSVEPSTQNDSQKTGGSEKNS